MDFSKFKDWYYKISTPLSLCVLGAYVYQLYRRTRVSYVQTEKAPKAIGPYCQAIVRGDIVYCSGQIALDPTTGEFVEGGLAQQAKQCLENMKAVLEKSGSSLDKVLKVNIYLQSMGDFAEFNEIYAGYFPTHKPARACVEVSKLPRSALVELECTAYI